ncbi:hypothetical protein ACIRYZ_27735 [Kitasatospora sp. NPDC101155]|uniref:hypothetical protein n=1 Tax=Kitasatospora sp. NPDC101155 TaxID=3364097 RepID=UPI0038067332
MASATCNNVPAGTVWHVETVCFYVISNQPITYWVIDMDIQGFFDNLDHDLVLKAVAHHTDQRWVLLYNGKLNLAKIGDVRVKWSRALPVDPSSVTIVLDPAGRYHASFVEENRRRLLGVLLAKVELEVTAATRLGIDQDQAEVLLGWIDQAGPDGSAVSTNALTNRLQRTGVQLMDLDQDETPPGRMASAMAIAVAADALSAHLHFENGDVDGVRRALGRTEAALIEAQQSIHDLRVEIGDVDEEPAD